jgi:hypothetical protein
MEREPGDKPIAGCVGAADLVGNGKRVTWMIPDG